MDLKAILRKVKLAIASVVTRIGIREVDAIALCSQMHGLALLDERMEPITPLYTYLDIRAYRWAELLESEYGPELYRETGCPPLFIYPLAKFLWLKERGLLSEARYIATSAKDYVIYGLTGRFVAEPSTASGS